MFITSFEEQNITYRSCSNFRIHLWKLTLSQPNIFPATQLMKIIFNTT
ncbi:hypothetical protein GPS60_12735 [Acinetobacter haemolyticus]|nr:hypothetical protein [Acinetobacter haemolyticus]